MKHQIALLCGLLLSKADLLYPTNWQQQQEVISSILFTQPILQTETQLVWQIDGSRVHFFLQSTTPGGTSVIFIPILDRY